MTGCSAAAAIAAGKNNASGVHFPDLLQTQIIRMHLTIDIAFSDPSRDQAMECPGRKLYAVQFHPEVMHTVEGMTMLRNFVLDICGCRGDWKMDAFVETTTF